MGIVCDCSVLLKVVSCVSLKQVIRSENPNPTHMFDEFDELDASSVGAALNRCRALAAKIANELRNKRPEQFLDKLSLADVHACLERAADVLSRVKQRLR